MKEPTFIKTADKQPAALLEMSPPKGNPQVYLNLN